MGSLKDQIFFSIFSIFSTFQTILSNFFLVITEFFFFFEIFNFLDELGDSKTFLFFKVKSSFFWQFDYRKWEILVSPNSTRLVDIVGIFPNILQNFRGGGGRGRGGTEILFCDNTHFWPDNTSTFDSTGSYRSLISSFTKMRRWGGVEGEGGVGLNSCMQNRPLFQQNTTRRYTCDT